MNAPRPQLKLDIGHATDKGRKSVNQDYFGSHIPRGRLLTEKGAAVAVADGISSSGVSQIASESAVNGFLTDYFSTSDAWSVKTSGKKVLEANNSWLHAQTLQSPYRLDMNRGYVCTFSALVFKSHTVHVFHVGDTRVYQVHDQALEQLTEDHRIWLSEGKSYLSQALGIKPYLDFDYRPLTIHRHDLFMLATDGIYEFVRSEQIIEAIKHTENLTQASERILKTALDAGSDDNVTVLLVRVDELAEQTASESIRELNELPFPPELQPGSQLDGYRIIRKIHFSARSHVFLAEDLESQTQVVLKTPSVDLRSDPTHLEGFFMEEWIARRINHINVLGAFSNRHPRSCLYTAMEFIEGQTLEQWMRDHPHPDLEQVRDIITQIARGLRALHRLEMLHQDLRPANVMIDRQGTVKLIDFGAVRIAGLADVGTNAHQDHRMGTAQYSAPEYFLGETPDTRADQYSLGVIAYQLLSGGKLPYGADAARARTRNAQLRLNYRTVLHDERDIPVWIDSALRKAVHPEPRKRYEEITEFLYDLRHPNQSFTSQQQTPLIARNPLRFWKSVALGFLIVTLALLVDKFY